MCNISFHGNHKNGCPRCNDANVELKKQLAAKEETIEILNKSIHASPEGNALAFAEAMKATTEMTKAMQATMLTMQSMMKDLSVELQRSRDETRKDPSACGGVPKQHGGHGSVPDDPGRRRGRRATFEDDLWDDHDNLLSDLLHRTEKKRSKFDIIRFLPENERKKTNPIETPEKLIVLLTCLIDYLEDSGVPTKGLRSHMIYVATMSSQGIYDLKSLLAYDAAIRDKAENTQVGEGMDPFPGVDTGLSNFHLGYDGTKHAKSLSGNSQPVWGSGRGRGAGGRGRFSSNQRQSFTGWKKVAAERGCCFTYSNGRVCEGCAFKHQCAYCNSFDHGMLKCKTNDSNVNHSQ